MRLAAAYILSPEALGELARALMAEKSPTQAPKTDEVYQLASVDGSWTLWLEPTVLSLQTSSSRPEDVTQLLDQVWAWLSNDLLEFERVVLAYSSTIPMRRRRIEDFLTESVVELLQDYDQAFTQALSGTWHRGHYTLQYGVQSTEEKTLYLSDAQVVAPNVHAEELAAVLWDLDQEGLRLLSWPITEQALESLQGDEDFSLHHQLMHLDVQRFQPALWESALDEASRERTALLARKHGRREFSPQDEERLGELTAKVRLLLPHVTQRDWQFAEDVNSRLDEVQERTQRIQKKYGLGG